mmetsp:Transcript_46377/g.91994  ORF Transcript_46377/g.91994 Transcript_46377/m.91994 type:complete len:204 (+) Transcript_46377:37-648(+)
MRWASHNGGIPMQLCRRASEAASMQPSLKQAGIALAATAGLGIISAPFGLATGFLVRSPAPPKRLIAMTLLRTFFFPCLLEELFWRAVLLPQPNEKSWPWGQAVLFNLGFVLYHVPAGWLLTWSKAVPGACACFKDTSFLVLAMLLGFACTWAYWMSGGSLWVATIVHWLPVNVWLLLYGGEQQLRGVSARDQGADQQSPDHC